jgi:GrpB-like predicted nucleotidyltransferase (UPF0157 family)
MSSDPILIVPYSTVWPAEFEREKQRLHEAIGTWTVDIEHIGSTAVPGLAAKPTVDILIAIDTLQNSVHLISPLRKLGYTYVPEYEVDLPERRYFFKGSCAEDAFHLHVVEKDTPFWRRHIAFRDYLRAHPAEMQAYARLKIDLADQYQADRSGYTDAKTAFIKAIEEKAFS